MDNTDTDYDKIETDSLDEQAALETLELIADDVYNLDRPSHLVLKDLVLVIKLIEERVDLLGLNVRTGGE